MYHYEKVLKASDQGDIVWFVSSAYNLRRHWPGYGCVGRVKRAICFTGATEMFCTAKLFEGRLALNPGFFFFCAETFL